MPKRKDQKPRDRRQEKDLAIARAEDRLRSTLSLGDRVVGVPILFSEPEILLITGWGRSTLAREVAAGTFPSPRYSTGNRGRKQWLSTEIAAWAEKLRRAS